MHHTGIGQQLYSLLSRFFDTEDAEKQALIEESLQIEQRLYKCFSKFSGEKYYSLNDQGLQVFDFLNSDHMATLLYLASNQVYRRHGETPLATKLSYLNKILHGIDLFHFVAMPESFLLSHPIGSVIGRAKIGDGVRILQGVTIGGKNANYPILGENVSLLSGSSIIGACNLGDNVIVGARTFLIDTEVPSNCTVVGQFPNHRILPNA